MGILPAPSAAVTEPARTTPVKHNAPRATRGHSAAPLLRAENRRLKQLVADLMLDNHLLRTEVARRLLDRLRDQIDRAREPV